MRPPGKPRKATHRASRPAPIIVRDRPGFATIQSPGPASSVTLRPLGSATLRPADPPPGPSHPAIRMILHARHAMRSRPSKARPNGARVWYRVMKCPVAGCGREVYRMENVVRGNVYWCRGDGVVGERTA
jgi:hypothetical protein